MSAAAKLIGLVLLFVCFVLSCSKPKPGEEQIKAWVSEHPELWDGAVDYDSLRVLIEPDEVRDSIEGEHYEIQMTVLQYLDTSRGEGKVQYQLTQTVIDSINKARPKVQIGWTCGLGRGEPRQLYLYLDVAYRVDSAFEESAFGRSRRVFP
jgi:hypothetical protein